MNSGAENFLVSITIGQFFSPNIWQMMTFLNPLDTLIPKTPFSFFQDLRGPGVSLGGILGVLSIEPFLGERGV